MPTARWAAVAASLFWMGCGTLQRACRPDFSLSPEDVKRSQAWAHYAHGLLLEAEAGRGASVALRAFEKARERDPAGRHPTEALALNLLHQSRTQEALEALAARCEIHPEDFNAHLALARTAEIAGVFDLAAAHYARAEHLQPDNLEPSFGHIRCLFSAHRDREALRAMQTLHRRRSKDETRLVPSQWAVHFLLRENEPRRAMPCLELSAKWATNDTMRATYLAVLGETMLAAGYPPRAARRAFQRALAVDSRCAPALHGLGSLLADRRDTNAIARLARHAPRRADPLSDFLVAAFAYERLDAHADAADVLVTAWQTLKQRSHPIPECFFHRLGAALDDLERDDEAATVFQDALAFFPYSHTILNHLAYMWAVNNTNLQQAAQLAIRALALSPGNAAYLDTLGWVRFREGNFHEALVRLMQALQIMGAHPHPIVLDHVGDALAALGRIHEARAFWSRSFALDNQQPGLAEKLRLHGVDPALVPLHPGAPDSSDF